MSDSEYWQFCESIEWTIIPDPAISTPAESKQVVLEQYTDAGEYRGRPLKTVMEDVADE